MKQPVCSATGVFNQTSLDSLRKKLDNLGHTTVNSEFAVEKNCEDTPPLTCGSDMMYARRRLDFPRAPRRTVLCDHKLVMMGSWAFVDQGTGEKAKTTNWAGTTFRKHETTSAVRIPPMHS